MCLCSTELSDNNGTKDKDSTSSDTVMEAPSEVSGSVSVAAGVEKFSSSTDTMPEDDDTLAASPHLQHSTPFPSDASTTLSSGN